MRAVAEGLGARLPTSAQRHVVLAGRNGECVSQVVYNLYLRRQHERSVLTAANHNDVGHGFVTPAEPAKMVRVARAGQPLRICINLPSCAPPGVPPPVESPAIRRSASALCPGRAIA